MSETSWVLLVYGILLAYFLTLHLSYLLLLAVGVAANRRRDREVRATDMEQVQSSALTIPVSVLIPAHNEESGITDTVRSVLASQFPELEVIVVDDGSTDRTVQVLSEAFDLALEVRIPSGEVPTRPVRRIHRARRDPRLWVVQKENGGKADASNVGLNFARYRYVVLTDADGIFAPDGLSRMIRLINFDPGRIVALGGTLRLLNGCDVVEGRLSECRLPREWLVRFQLLEYCSVFLSNRLGWSALNAVPVVSGGVGMWRKDIVREIGGFSTETTHEDLDTTMRLHEHFRRIGKEYRIVYVPDSVVWTEVPHTWLGLYRQRKRWQRALFETVWRGRRMWFRPRYGAVGMLLMPYLLIYEALGPFVELVSYVLTAILLVVGIAEAPLLLAFLVAAAGLTAVLRLVCLTVDLIYYDSMPVRDVVRLWVAALLEYWIYRPFLLIPRVMALAEFLRGHTGHEKAPRQPRSHPAEAAAGSS